MFKWFWTIFSLGAPDEVVNILVKYVLLQLIEELTCSEEGIFTFRAWSGAPNVSFRKISVRKTI